MPDQRVSGPEAEPNSCRRRGGPACVVTCRGGGNGALSREASRHHRAGPAADRGRVRRLCLAVGLRPDPANMKKGAVLRAPFRGGDQPFYEPTPSSALGQIIESSTSSPMNFRRTRNKRRCNVQQPTSPASRTGSTAPTRPVVEGRSGILVTVSKSHASNRRIQTVYSQWKRVAMLFLPAHPTPDMPSMSKMIHFPVVIATRNFTAERSPVRQCRAHCPVLPSLLSGAN
jgi:hypothetical protein